LNIYIPFLGMMSLTLMVWLAMYAKRLSWMAKNNIAPDAISTPEKIASVLPESVNNASNNLKNLFELPVLFYVICIYIGTNALSNEFSIYCAYSFFVFRCLHSLIQCTSNYVPARFTLYLCSSVSLWLLVISCILPFI